MASGLDDLFTPESLALEQQCRETARGPAEQMLAHYRDDRDALLASYRAIGQWNAALEDRDLEGATAPELWGQMVDDGLVELPRLNESHSTNAVYEFRIISPKVLDAFRDEPGTPRTDFALTTLRVCLRKTSIDCPRLQVPASWMDAALIDTELFEIPPGVAPDTFDDCEKIHVVYLAGVQDGHLEYRPVFIGIGTGEAYGVGPRVRTTPGRFRFYRYDIKDNFHLEYIRATTGPEIDSRDVQDIPLPTEVHADHAALVLGRGGADRGMMCLSDPVLERIHRDWLIQNPHNHVVYQGIGLEQVRHDLRSENPNIGFAPNDVAAVLRYAFENHRWFFVAWQHPERLSEAEGLLRYYRELPEYRRSEYELRRLRAESLGLDSHTAHSMDLSIAGVLRCERLRSELDRRHPGVSDRLLTWLTGQVSRDLYDFGNHPEVRLCTAIALWNRLVATSAWDAALQAAYRQRLHELTCMFDPSCVT